MFKQTDPFGGHSYAFANGRIKALEETLLKEADFDAISQCESYEKALGFLLDKSYGSCADCRDVEQLIESEIEKTYKVISEITPNKQLTDLFLLDIDAHNLKVYLKARFSLENTDSLVISGGCFPCELLAACVKVDDFSALGESFQQYLKASSKISDPQTLSTLVDQAMFLHIFKVLEKNKNQLVYKFFEKKALLLNANMKIRAKSLAYSDEKIASMMIKLPDNKDMDLPDDCTSYDIEKQMQLELPESIRSKKHDTFSIAPVICFLLDKIDESKRLRIIFSQIESK